MSLSARRAWIEILSAVVTEPLILSLSARRAWIEITLVQIIISGYAVALRKESVDRNRVDFFFACCIIKVALRKESVDRNTSFHSACLFDLRRSPQGERG